MTGGTALISWGTVRDGDRCGSVNTLQEAFRSQARAMIDITRKLTEGISPSSEGNEDGLMDDYTLSLANEVMQTLYALVEKQVDAAAWFKNPIEH
jgi:hypothetical protein